MAEAYPSLEFRCLLCQELYKSPRELPCGHTFCCPCLTTYIQAEHVSADEDRHYFPCPVCDTPIVPRDPSVHVNTWATSFPLKRLFLSSTTQTLDERVCGACLRGGDSNTAEVWCTDCAEMLCKQCRICHERNKMSAKHTYVSIFEEAGVIQDIVVNEICPNHEGKTSKFYCMDHRSVCCSVCVALSHRNCNDIKPLDDVVGEAASGKHDTEWEDIREETKKMLEDGNSQMINFNSKQQEASTKVTQVIQRTKDKLGDLNTTFQSDLVRKCNTHKRQMSSRLRCVSIFNTNVQNSHLLMDRLEKQGSARQMFITREKEKNQMSEHYRRMDQNTKKQPNTFDITLKIGTIVDEIMKVTTVSNADVTSSISLTSQNANARIGTLLGTILSKPSPTISMDCTSASDLTDTLHNLTIQTTVAAAMVDVWTSDVVCVKNVQSSELGGLSAPWLTAGTFTDSGQILITDTNNRRLLLFDDTYNFLSEFKVDGDLEDVTRGRVADEIFVALLGGQILRCILQNNVLTLIGKMTCPHDSFAIAVHGDTILAGTPDRVHVLSMDGRVARSISRGIGGYLAISTSAASLYHTDANDIVCRRLDSDAVVYTYSDAGLKYPVGIGLDQNDNVYVCGCNSRSVYLISPDGSRGKVLDTRLSSINNPYGIVVHPTKQEVVVTSQWESTSFEVYQFRNNAY